MAFEKKNPPQTCAAETRALAATGYDKKSIAAYFGVATSTFDRWMEEYPEIAEQFAQGRETERLALHNMLYRQAMEKGNATAAMFLLKTRFGYREGDQSDTANRVQVVFNLPGALSPDQYKTLEGVAKPKKRERLTDGD